MAQKKGGANQMAKAGKFAAGAAVAALAGYVAGILTAPKSGKETRQDIKDTASKGFTEAERHLKQLHTELSSLLDDAGVKAAETKGKAKTEVEELIGHAKIIKEKARTALSSFHEGESDDKDLQKAIDEAHKVIEHLRKFMAKQ
jgi:gas vesicle protein